MKKTTKRILGALAILAAFTFISCQSDDSNGSDSDTDTPNVKLPGTPGGTSNPNDIFAGKTFYDEDEKKFEKFEFSDNGTMTLYYNHADPYNQEEWSKSLEYSYSIGDNNSANFVTKKVYQNEKAYSYSEALELTNSFDKNYFLENLKEDYDDEEFDFTTEEGLLDCIKYDLSKKGIFLNKNIDYILLDSI